MLHKRMVFIWMIMLGAFVFSETTPNAFADAVTDIQVIETNGKLSTNLSKYAGAFDELTFKTKDPGFAGDPPQDQAYGIQVAQQLWYHSGIEGAPVAAVPGGVSVAVSDGITTLNVSGTSGLQAGLVLTGSLSGSLHAHLDFVLSPNTAPAGVYGLVLQLTSPSFQTSDPFLLTLASVAGGSLSIEGIEYGEQAIFNAAMVPEPSSVVLAGLGAAGVLAAGWRRRRRAAARNSAAAEIAG